MRVFDNIFMKVFKYLFAIMVIFGIGVIIFAKVNNLKLYTGFFIISSFGVFLYCVFMAGVISMNMKQGDTTIKNIKNRDKIVEFLQKDYELILENDSKSVYKCKSSPQYIYRDVKVNINIDANGDKLEISAPVYFIRRLKKLNFE
ncbi:hypothetical protein [Oceanivirga salmonicida]|uniref:hypothetical protein n=1 Tax=Oceanivirga salmonicida TaxID=1769291 RepID=UPI000835C641|nr:hypothetical protein [Oceanivirga salmonicida]